MVRSIVRIGLVLVFLSCALPVIAQQAATSGDGIVPAMVNFSGTLTDGNGKLLSGLMGVTFYLYKDAQGGSPLWLETQSVQADNSGHYKVMLGSTSSHGLPAELFVSGEARWLGVQVQGEAEQPRVVLLSVPYALKAGDAQTVGGLPPSAFVMAVPVGGGSGTTSSTTSASGSSLEPSNPPVSGSGTTNFVPLWTPNGTTLGNSTMFQLGTGTTAKIGIGITAPLTTLDVKGTGLFRGLLEMATLGFATPTKGFSSNAFNFEASSYNSGTAASTLQHFQWQAEPTGNNTTTPSATLNLLFGVEPAAPSETGLKLSSKGVFTFAAGQTFPGAGTVSSVGLSAPASDFTITGSPVTNSGTLGVNWNVTPTSANTLNAIVKRDGTGSFNAENIGAVTLTASNPAGFAIVGSTSAPSGAIEGVNTGTSSVSDGVDGVTSSGFAAGVAGINNGGGFGVYGSGGFGVYGISSTSFGTIGQYGSESGQGILNIAPAGVWGDGGSPGAIGVLGTADVTSAGVFVNASDIEPTLYALNNVLGGFPFYAETYTAAYCYVDGGGNINCSGTKNAVVPIDSGKRKVALSAIESPENWFEDFGSAQLVNGVAVIRLDPDFIQTVNTEKEYRVFPVPNGDCRGLYVTNKSANSFEVRELGGGTSNIRFDYRITAIRRKYETVRFADHTSDPDPRKMLQQMRKGKPASTVVPAFVTPFSHAKVGVPVAEITNK
jgi:hypothetical protein